MVTGHRIRVAELADVPTIEACVREAYARYVPLIGRRPAPMDDDYLDHVQQRHVYVIGDDEVRGLLVLVPHHDFDD